MALRGRGTLAAAAARALRSLGVVGATFSYDERNEPRSRMHRRR